MPTDTQIRRTEAQKHRRNLGELYEVAKAATDHEIAVTRRQDTLVVLCEAVKKARAKGISVERLVEVTGEHESMIEAWITGHKVRELDDGRVYIDLNNLRNMLYESIDEEIERKKKANEYSSGFESSNIMQIMRKKLREKGYDIHEEEQDG
jgi:hypothetical protein